MTPARQDDRHRGCPVVHVDHHSSQWARERHGVLAELRRDSPIAYSDEYEGFYVSSSYAIGREILRDDEHFAVRRFDDGSGGLLIPAVMRAPTLLPGELDGPEHLAYRKAMHAMFKPPQVKELEPFVTAIVDETLDGVITKRRFDAVADITQVVPARVIMEYLGLPADRRDTFLEGLMLGFKAAPDPREEADAEERFRATWEQMLEVVAAKRRQPGDDVISHLVRSEDPVFSDEELLSIVMNLALGGTATTMAWMGYGLMRLEQDRELRARLIADPEEIPAFGEECLRYYTPAASLARNVIKDVEVGGVQLRAGDRVLVVLPSLNRDDTTFEDGEEFDPGRPKKQHMAFGVGAHFCVGVHLARLEFRVLIERVLARMPEYRIDVPSARHNESVGVTPHWDTLPATVAG
jgi:cytochrome P450